MSFDLDEQELRDAVARGDADFLWAAYRDLLADRRERIAREAQIQATLARTCACCPRRATAVAACRDCGRAYGRCDAHGGLDGAKRSLRSHQGLWGGRCRG